MLYYTLAVVTTATAHIKNVVTQCQHKDLDHHKGQGGCDGQAQGHLVACQIPADIIRFVLHWLTA